MASAVQLHHLEGSRTGTGADWDPCQPWLQAQLCPERLHGTGGPRPTPQRGLHPWEMLTPRGKPQRLLPAPAWGRQAPKHHEALSMYMGGRGRGHELLPPPSPRPRPTFLMASICARSRRRSRTQRRRRLVWYIFSAGTQALGLRSGGMVMPYSQPWGQRGHRGEEAPPRRPPTSLHTRPSWSSFHSKALCRHDVVFPFAGPCNRQAARAAAKGGPPGVPRGWARGVPPALGPAAAPGRSPLSFLPQPQRCEHRGCSPAWCLPARSSQQPQKPPVKNSLAFPQQ